MHQLSPQDSQFLYMETNKSLSQVTSLVILDPSTTKSGTVRFKQIIGHVQSRLNTSPIYRRRIYHLPLEFDYPYWIDDEHFDIEYHIRHSRLPHPADWRQLCIHLARFHSRPLDMQRAPWEMYVIEGLDNIEGIPKGSYAIATKIHHAAADGMAIVNFLDGLLDIDKKGTPVMQPSQDLTPKRHAKPTPFQMSVRGTLNGLRSPLNVANTLLKYAPSMIQAAKKKIVERHKTAKVSVPNTRFNLETSPHRVFDSTCIELEELKSIKDVILGSTVNDVILTICAGALRNYLGHHKELPSESLRAFVPVNVRSDSNKTNNQVQQGNKISTMTPLLYTNIKDPIERFAAIRAETKEQKAVNKGISARLMTDITQHIPASTQLLAAKILMNSEMSGRMTNVCISNIPGPQIPLYMNGAHVVKQMGLGPLADRMGLFIVISSYNGNMAFSVTSCRRTLPDVDFFMECIRISFDELKSANKKHKQEKIKAIAKTKKKFNKKKTNT